MSWRRDGWERCIVAAPGPSLPLLVSRIIERQRDGYRVIAVTDAWYALPGADVLYACDRAWWDYHGASLAGAFAGERWSSTTSDAHTDDDKYKWGRCREFHVKLVQASPHLGFCFVPGHIHYGDNSGFQAVNLAIQFGAKEVRLAGFDMHEIAPGVGRFREHAPPLRTASDYPTFIAAFTEAAACLPPHLSIVNCTPDSSLDCFPREAL